VLLIAITIRVHPGFAVVFIEIAEKPECIRFEDLRLACHGSPVTALPQNIARKRPNTNG
jgi:hypothetical protein